MQMLSLESMFGANTESPCVKMVYGVSGSGKTVFLCESLRKAARSKSFDGNHRFIIFDVKNEGYETLAPPVETADEAIERISQDRVVVIHPSISLAPIYLDRIIEHLFDLSNANPKFTATLLIEECSTYIGSSAGSIPNSIKRFATQGRSKGLSLILVNQRALTNKWTDTQSQGITLFRLAKPDSAMLNLRWGLDSDSINEKLKEKKFSFAHYDLEELELSYYDPIEIPELRVPIVVKKKSRFTKMLRWPF